MEDLNDIELYRDVQFDKISSTFRENTSRIHLTATTTMTQCPTADSDDGDGEDGTDGEGDKGPNLGTTIGLGSRVLKSWKARFGKLAHPYASAG